MLDVTCWVDSSYEAFTGWKCLFLLFQLLLTNPFLFIFFSIKKEVTSLNCCVIENEIIRKKKKKQPVLCSSARCHCSPLILASYWCTGDFGVGSNKPDPQLEELNNYAPIVLGEPCLSWLCHLVSSKRGSRLPESWWDTGSFCSAILTGTWW